MSLVNIKNSKGPKTDPCGTSFSQNQNFRYTCLCVSNCNLLENILDTFYMVI